MTLRIVTKSRGSFLDEDALAKLDYLTPHDISKKWTRPIRNWIVALGRIPIMFDERMPQH